MLQAKVAYCYGMLAVFPPAKPKTQQFRNPRLLSSFHLREGFIIPNIQRLLFVCLFPRYFTFVLPRFKFCHPWRVRVRVNQLGNGSEMANLTSLGIKGLHSYIIIQARGPTCRYERSHVAPSGSRRSMRFKKRWRSLLHSQSGGKKSPHHQNPVMPCRFPPSPRYPNMPRSLHHFHRGRT